MKRVLLAAIAALGLTACADGYYGPYGGGGVAYYDDFYGPYAGGYWGPDEYFYYRDRDHRFVRDEGHHFRREQGQGFHGVHAQPGMHGWSRGARDAGGSRPANGRPGGWAPPS